MKEQYKFIFDMDGTLYHFDKGKGQTFANSHFYSDLKTNVYNFLAKTRGLSTEEAVSEYERIKEKYDGEISLGVEREYNIDRYQYFNNTWNIDPTNYIEKDMELAEALQSLKGRIAILTAAPRIWAVNVLAYLGLENIFEENIYTGESDERKPSTAVFQRIADKFKVSPRNVFSIGDQEYSDIIPAKRIGMRTVLIGEAQQTVADYQASDVKLAINLLRKEGFV